jgi:hypothetical protein
LRQTISEKINTIPRDTVLLKVLSKLPLDRPDAREKVEKILSGLKWPQFPGLHSLLLKVRTYSLWPSIFLGSEFGTW